MEVEVVCDVDTALVDPGFDFVAMKFKIFCLPSFFLLFGSRRWTWIPICRRRINQNTSSKFSNKAV
jgi:hypothetical protein